MCEITISSSSVFRILDERRVSGTVQGCEAALDTGSVIQVDFDCNGTITNAFPSVDGQGFWYASVAAGNCDCAAPGEAPQQVTVTVSCLSPIGEDPCPPLVQTLPLVCFKSCIQGTGDPDGDDVPVVDITWACEPGGGPNADVKFRFFVRNDLPFDAFVNIANPSLVSVLPISPPIVPAGTTQQIEIIAKVATPLTSPNDIFTVFFTDANGDTIPCPGFTRTVTIANSCCPLNAAPRMEISTSGCSVTLSWDKDLVADGCFLQFDFKDPANASAQTSNPGDPSKTYDYAANGVYEDLSVYVKCANGCTGSPRIFGPVTITGCDGPGLPDPPGTQEPESTACGATRVVAVVTGAMSLFLFIASWCLGGSALWQGAILLGLISGLLWFLYWLFSCNTPCGVVKLSAAETLIAAGLALLTYSACCTAWFLAVGTIFVLAGLYLFNQWKQDCNISACHAWGELAALGVVVTTYLIVVLDLFPGLTACKAAIITWQGVDLTGSKIVLVITAFAIFKLKACAQVAAPDTQVATDE